MSGGLRTGTPAGTSAPTPPPHGSAVLVVVLVTGHDVIVHHRYRTGLVGFDDLVPLVVGGGGRAAGRVGHRPDLLGHVGARLLGHGLGRDDHAAPLAVVAGLAERLEQALTDP